MISFFSILSYFLIPNPSIPQRSSGSFPTKRRSSSQSSSSSSSSPSRVQQKGNTSQFQRKKQQRQATPPRHKLNDADKKRRLEEMMENAKWRDEQRAGNLKRYKEEEGRERDEREKGQGKGFLR